MKKFAILALALLVAIPASAAGVTISGYLDIGFISAEGGSAAVPLTPTNGIQATTATRGGWNTNDQFVINELNLDLASQLTNDISMFASLDFVGAGVGIDYAYVDFANPGPFDLNVRVGRIPSVVGIEQRASESNQTKFINLSLLSPYTVGAIEGAAIYGSFSPVNYALAVSDADVVGSRLGAVGSALVAGLLTPGNNNGVANIAGTDADNDYAFSGRLGVVPIEGLEIGVSGSMDKFDIARNPGQINKLRTLLAIDASYSWGAFSLKGEYAGIKEETQNPQADLDGRGYYIEGVYDINSKWSVGARYSALKLENSAVVGSTNGVTADVNTITLAGSYRLADNVVLKAEYDLNQEKVLNSAQVGTPKPQNDVLALSLVASF